MFAFIRKLFSAPTTPKHAAFRVRRVASKYDAAQTTIENRRHWANSDNLSAAAANSADVRRTLRSRSRYETSNNCYAGGIVDTLANDLIGRGPRLQLLSNDDPANQTGEASFAVWSRNIGLAQKLRLMRRARAVDGEAVAVLVNDPASAHPAQLDLATVECEQLATPPWYRPANNSPEIIEGIEFDAANRPAFYWICKKHPTEIGWLDKANWQRLPAAVVLHWFAIKRPGQIRGIPDLTPALPLFGQLRRYTLAALAAAETAADFAGVVYTDTPAGGEADDVEPFLPIDIEQRALATMPAGWRLEQLKAEQPTTSYPAFKAELIGEIARVLQVPFNVAMGNSSGYNYASGRLDVQTYARAVTVDRDELEAVVLHKVVGAWLDEMALIPNAGIPDGRSWRNGLRWSFFWDGREHVDPTKEADAQATRLASNTTTLAIEYASRGLDWKEALQQRAREIAYGQTLGLPMHVEPAAKDTSPEEPATSKPTPDANASRLRGVGLN